ncbi:hypothetical protein Xcel_1465 [Xylanimonas cellulosilytica DSM 15894]|uniref:Uncharacterized protein n=1 Tax=Xylanimonas cellulosilytica (strain DSM 15894 / JCM 12276 / CECT 5975 / KCTC 9989 / LMG 20990 / NBRC 107835 / XIL07) TaxID=446471 RepID=D1BS04_XYLCX|nr:hypothetical protein [Xylanimonas cellulosilytica]ACZ30496.1 hypothetical protein Xcel_1465 [Xylanimonas cellulosilytica DSM 15894]
MTGYAARRAIERATALGALDEAERERRAARQSLRAALWMVPTAIVVTGIIILAWWWAQAAQAEPSPVPRRFAFGDAFPWYAIVPLNLYVVWLLTRAWLRWRKVSRPQGETSER